MKTQKDKKQVVDVTLNDMVQSNHKHGSMVGVDLNSLSNLNDSVIQVKQNTT